MPLNAGQLDRRIVVQRRTGDADDHGREEDVWEDVGTFWAQFVPEKAREYFAGGTERSGLTAVFRLRYATATEAAIDSSMRVLDGAVVFSVRGVMPSAAREWVDLACFSGERDTA